MTAVIRKSLRWSLLVVAVATVVVILGIVPLNAGFARGAVEKAVRDAVGLELSIGGPIRLRLGPWPRVTSGELVLGNVTQDPLLVVESLHAEIGLFALLRGRIHVLELEADGIAVDYCSQFPEFPDTETGDDPPPSVAVDDVVITGVSIRCGPPPGADPLELAIEQVMASAQRGTPIQANATGSFSGMAFELTLTGGELDDLVAATEPFPVTAALSSEAAAVDVSGHLVVSPPGPWIDAEVDVRETDVRAIAKAFDIELPALGSLNASGRLRGDLDTVDLVGFKGDLGASRFEFDTTLDLSGDRLHAGLAGVLDPLDVTPFLDAEPATHRSSSGLLDDDVDFSAVLDILDAIDADFEVRVSELSGLPVDVRAVEFEGQMTDGVVALQSLSADVLGGQVSGDGSLASQGECPELQLRARGTELDLAALDPLLSLVQPFGWDVNSVNLESSSCGTTLFAHRDSLRAGAEFAGVRASLGGERLPLSARRVHISSKPGERIQLQFLGNLMGEKLEATLAAGSLEALLGPDTWPVDMEARGGGGILKVNGRARLLTEQLLVDARARFDAPQAPLPLQATTRLRLDESRFVADGISISLGESDIGGRLAWNYAQDPSLLDLMIRSESLDLAEIATAFPAAAEQGASAIRETPADTGNAAAPFTLPPVNLDLAFDAIHDDRLDIKDLRLSGRLRKGLIEEARISLLVEDEIALHGGLDMDLRRLPARAEARFSAENLDIGRVLRRLEVVDDASIRADTLELLVTANGMTPGELLLNSQLRVDLRNFDWEIPKSVARSDTDTEDTLDVSLGQLQFTMAPDEPTTWVSRGSVGDSDVELWMQTPSLVETFGDEAELPIMLVAAVDSDVVMIDTRIDRSADERLVAHASLSGEVIDGQGRDLSKLASPLGDYQLQSDIIFDDGLLQLPNATMILGSSSAEGRFDMDTRGPRTRIEVALTAPHLQTDDLLYWSRIETDLEQSDTDVPDASGRSRGVLYLARDFLSEFRKDNDLDLHITVDELNAGPDYLGKGELRLYVDAGDFLLEPLTITLPGGGVDAAYTASTRNGYLDAGLRINADALTYGGLLRLADPESQARGLLFVDLDVSANTETTPGVAPFDLLFDKAYGSVSVAIWPENIEAGVLDLWSTNVVLALLPKPEAGKASRLNCAVTRFDINDGLMKSRVSLLDTTDTVIRGRGTINLAQDELDLLSWPQAKRERFFSASTPITVTGPFSDFQIGVAPAGFIGTLVKWYTNLVYVPYKWLTGERFPPDGTPTCFDAMDWELTPELHEYFLRRDFSAPPALP